MRLTNDQVHTILATVGEQAGRDARVVLFGSRTDDTRRGGDIDLLIESPTPPGLLQRARIKSILETRLQIPVDILAKTSDALPTAFQAIALITGIALEESR